MKNQLSHGRISSFLNIEQWIQNETHSLDLDISYLTAYAFAQRKVLFRWLCGHYHHHHGPQFQNTNEVVTYMHHEREARPSSPMLRYPTWFIETCVVELDITPTRSKSRKNSQIGTGKRDSYQQHHHQQTLNSGPISNVTRLSPMAPLMSTPLLITS